jgi:hypothetical protein
MLSLIHTPKPDEMKRIFMYFIKLKRKAFKLLPWRTLKELAKRYNQKVRELFDMYNLPNRKNGISIASTEFLTMFEKTCSIWLRSG